MNIKEKIENVRWHFFAYNKYAKKLTNFFTILWKKYPNKITKRLMLTTLPF